jgi:hypothetical protein
MGSNKQFRAFCKAVASAGNAIVVLPDAAKAFRSLR